jgi:hypothetical protein
VLRGAIALSRNRALLRVTQDHFGALRMTTDIISFPCGRSLAAL